MASNKKTPHHIDALVGANVRRFRLLHGMSQEQLAEQLGLTFQQVQKYEKGANRISASRLWQIAEVLGVEISAFFKQASFGGEGDGEPLEAAPDLDMSRVEYETLRLYRALDPNMQTRVRDLLRATTDLSGRN